MTPRTCHYCGQPLPERVGGQLKRIRLAAGLNRRQAGELLGVTPYTLWRWETDRARAGVTVDELRRLLNDH